jgi:hypothetical protein
VCSAPQNYAVCNRITSLDEDATVDGIYSQSYPALPDPGKDPVVSSDTIERYREVTGFRTIFRIRAVIGIKIARCFDCIPRPCVRASTHPCVVSPRFRPRLGGTILPRCV